MTRPVFRFAPSPNGYLHLGHARSALINFDMARAAGGRLLLRIEDIDEARCRPEFEAAIYDDLAWLGIAWEQPVLRQSAHFDDYRAALTRLAAQGLTNTGRRHHFTRSSSSQTIVTSSISTSLAPAFRELMETFEGQALVKLYLPTSLCS